MAEKKPDNLTLVDKLYRTKYEPDTAHSHIELDVKELGEEKARRLLKICPAEVYKKDPNDPSKVAVSHENCLECGTCRKAAGKKGLKWKSPKGGMGVKYRFG